MKLHHHGMGGGAKMGNRRRGPGSRVNLFESLEGRRLLSAGGWDLNVNPVGTLVISGGAGDDNVHLVVRDDSVYAAVYDHDFANGLSFNHFGRITGVKFDGAGGTDSLTLENLSGDDALPVTLVGGAGDDAVIAADGGYQVRDGAVVSHEGSAHAGAWLDEAGIVHVRGTASWDELYVGVSADPDRLAVYMNSVGTTFALAEVKGVVMDGGEGNDLLAVVEEYGALNVPVTFLDSGGDDAIATVAAEEDPAAEEGPVAEDEIAAGGEETSIQSSQGNAAESGHDTSQGDSVYVGAIELPATTFGRAKVAGDEAEPALWA
jgi:hypothetical protein